MDRKYDIKKSLLKKKLKRQKLRILKKHCESSDHLRRAAPNKKQYKIYSEISLTTLYHIFISFFD